MTISKVDSILSKHPFFKKMDTNRKIGIYNKIYTKIFYLRSDITVINPITYTADKSYQLYHEPPEDVNLSAHKDVDSLMQEHSLLKNLSSAQKIAIFEIAAYRINMYRTLREDQEYYFSTHKEDVAYKKKYIYQPLLSAVVKILTATVKNYIYAPLAVATGVILGVLSKTTIFQPLLLVSSKIWQFASSTFTYIPLQKVEYDILQGEGPKVTNIYLPPLAVTYLTVVSHSIIVTYSSTLGATYDIITDADYTESYTYTAPLGLTVNIEGVGIGIAP